MPTSFRPVQTDNITRFKIISGIVVSYAELQRVNVFSKKKWACNGRTFKTNMYVDIHYSIEEGSSSMHYSIHV